MNLPLYRNVCVGWDSYLADPEMQRVLPSASRSWHFNGRVRSMQLYGGYMKSLSGFADHANDEWNFLTLMQDLYEKGLKRPSSYASVFHHFIKSPFIKWSFNGPFVEYFAGGWEEARFTGEYHDRLYQYDINSAYLWSLQQGLPNTETFRAEDFPKPVYSEMHGFSEPGIYLIELHAPVIDAPYPFNMPSLYYVATTEEIEAYQLPVKSYRFGVTWAPVLLSTARMTDLIHSLPCAKQTARSYWGRWASAAKLECVTPARTWGVRNPMLNVVWAHLILSRVKLKIYREVTYPKHIYVDSVIVDHELGTGTDPGEWRLVASYENGLNIAGTGMYGPIGGPLDKHIGMKRN